MKEELMNRPCFDKTRAISLSDGCVQTYTMNSAITNSLIPRPVLPQASPTPGQSYPRPVPPRGQSYPRLVLPRGRSCPGPVLPQASPTPGRSYPRPVLPQLSPSHHTLHTSPFPQPRPALEGEEEGGEKRREVRRGER